MVQPPKGARVFALQRRGLLGDCAPSGRVRLDALARWLQDVAYTDVEQAGVQDLAFWVLRRTRIKVERFPQFGEDCGVQTFCSALGKMWAERRTTIVSEGTPIVETVALWVHLDPVRKVPSPLSAREIELYAQAAGDRRVLARLRHPRPGAIAWEGKWNFRHTDMDVADHINNASYWSPLEDELLRLTGVTLTQIDAEIEFRSPAQPGLVKVLADGSRRWLVDAQSGEVYASTVLMNARTTAGSN